MRKARARVRFFLSDGKGRAATARRRGVRVFDHETGADQFVAVVDHRILQEGKRDGIHQNLRPVLFQDQVVGGGIVQLYVVLEAGAAPPFDRDAEGFLFTRRLAYFLEARIGAVGDAGEGRGP